jgi:aminoglycoside phosphotransferase (APT) family kinase protein
VPLQEVWPSGWPAEVQRCVREVVGSVHGAQVLEGMSGRDVRRVDGERGSVVVKGPADPRELAFYTEVAPVLEGVPVPHLLGAYRVDGSHWLVLEYLPHVLPRSEWAGNTAAYDVLAQLHATASAAFDRLPEPFQPRWTDDMTEQVSAAIDMDLSTWQDETREWLSGDTPISGDANPRNWATRDDGTLVLLDWERAGRGGPAVDVATTVPGLPTRAETQAASAAYQDARQRHGAPFDAGDFARGIRLAKLWTAVELLHEDGVNPGLRQAQRWLRTAVPRWLENEP